MLLSRFCKHVRLTNNHSLITLARVIAVSYLLTMLPIQGVLAQNSTWNGPDLTGDWDGDNWTPGGDPPDGIGFFDTAGNVVTVVNPATVGEINFTASPNTFNINSDFTLNAAGITGPNANGVTFTINLEGTLAFTNAATAAGAAITNNGVVDISGLTAGGASIGSLSGTGNVNLGAKILTLGTLGLDDLFSGRITGSGGLTKTGGGNLTLTGVNSYTGGVKITSGTLTGNATSLTGNIVNNAALVFNQLEDGIFKGRISGTGTFTKTGDGDLTLTGINTYTGGTTITEGILTGNTNSLPGNIVNNAALVFNQFEDGIFKGSISGTGSFTKTGDGNLTLTGNSPYSGSTIVQEGALTVNGALLNSAVSVTSGATIMGTGSMKSLTLDGIIAPGNSIGKLTVAKGFTMSSSSQYNAEVSMSGASDLIAVGGFAQLNGTLNVLSSDPISSLSGKAYTILTAGNGVTGTFNSTGFNNNGSSNIYTVTYNSNSVTVNFPTVGAVAPQTTAAEGTLDPALAWAPLSAVNSQQVTTIQDAPLGESGGSCAAAFPVAFNKLVERQKSLALNSRGIIPSVGRKKRYVETPDVETRVIPISEKIKIGKTNVWMQNYDQVSWLKGSTGATGKTYGGVLGADYEIFKNTFFGFFGGSSISPIHMKSGLGKSQVKSYYGGIYATRTTSVGTYVSGQIMGGGNSYNSHRNINFGNFNLKAHSKHRGGQFFSRVEVGQVVPLSVVVVLPFLNVGYGLVHEQKAIEKGAGLYNFATNHQSAQSMRGEIGARIYRTYNIMEAFIRPEFDISYILTRGVGSRNGKGHFVGDPLIISLPGGRRTLNQVAPGFSLSALFKEGIFIIGGVNSQLSGTLKTVGATATVGYNF